MQCSECGHKCEWQKLRKQKERITNGRKAKERMSKSRKRGNQKSKWQKRRISKVFSPSTVNYAIDKRTNTKSTNDKQAKYDKKSEWQKGLMSNVFSPSTAIRNVAIVGRRANDECQKGRLTKSANDKKSECSMSFAQPSTINKLVNDKNYKGKYK